LWSDGDGFLAAAALGNGKRRLREISPTGITLWTADLDGGPLKRPIIRRPWAVVTNENGSSFDVEYAVALGTSGGLRGQLGTSDAVAEVKPPEVLLSGDPIGELEDHFLTFDVVRVTIPNVHTGPPMPGYAYRYAPDYDQNLSALRRTPSATWAETANTVRIDGGWVYGLIGSRLYRYRLAPGYGQHPLAIGDVMAIGGVVRGGIVVTRPNGLWWLRQRGNTIEATPLASTSSAVTALRAEGARIYAGFANGRVAGYDLDGTSVTFDADIGCATSRFALSAKRVYALCRSAPEWRLAAFDRD
jgi:hypothetical protein